MTAGRNIEVHALHWQGVDLEVTFERNWLNIERDQATAHLSVTSIAPEGAPLPITDRLSLALRPSHRYRCGERPLLPMWRLRSAPWGSPANGWPYEQNSRRLSLF